MGEALHDNLKLLREAFGEAEIANILHGERFEVDGIEFVSEYDQRSSATRFSIVKPPHLVERYRALCAAAHGGNIMELGIAEGGSAALMALWAQPAKLVAIDLEPQRLAALDEFVAARGLTGSVSAHYGIDQADRPRLQELVANEFGGAPLDLIVDDASHYFAPTRASFEALFPYLRPGGVYVIEDWNSDVAMVEAFARALRNPQSPHHAAVTQAFRERATGENKGTKTGPFQDHVPLTRLALELVLGCAVDRGVVDEVHMNKGFVAVTRGPATLDPATFDMTTVYADPFGFLGAID